MADDESRPIRGPRDRYSVRPRGVNYLARNPMETVQLAEAMRILRDYLEKVDAQKAPQTWSLGLVLLGFGEALSGLKRDVDLLHSKLQPLLRELQEVRAEAELHRKDPKSRR